MKMEFVWLRLSSPNPENKFWEKLDELSKTLELRVRKILPEDGEGKARKLIGQLVTTVTPSDTLRICILHVNDVKPCLGDLFIEEWRSLKSFPDPNCVTLYITEGDPTPNSTPPVLNLSRQVLPFLESQLFPLLKRGAGKEEFETLFASWAGNLKRFTDFLMELLPLDILVQGAVMLLESKDAKHAAAIKSIRENPFNWYADAMSSLPKDLLAATDSLPAQIKPLLPGGKMDFARLMDRLTGSERLTDNEILLSPEFLQRCHDSFVQVAKHPAN